MPGPSFRWLARVLFLLAVAGCVDLGIDDADLPTIWNGDLQAEPEYPGLTGRAAAVSETGGTAATVLLQGAEAGASYAWGLWLGTCEQPEHQIGPDTDYPHLEADDLGDATQNARLGPRLSLDRNYHVQVVTITERGRVACADLIGELAS